jgi:hypothetical protein
MSLRADIKAAKAAIDKLNTYSNGVFAAGGRDATRKYEELNSKADDAIRKLPPGILRTNLGLDLAAAICNLRNR